MPRLITMIFGFMFGLALRKKKHGHSDRKQSGLLKPETRPALSPEERTKMVESLIFSWPSAHNASVTLDFAQIDDLPTHTYVPVRIVMAFLSWRGATDRITSWPAMEAMNALVRQVVSNTNQSCRYDAAVIPDWMTPPNDDELRSINKMWMASVWAKRGDYGSFTYAGIAQDIEDHKAFGAYAMDLVERHNKEKTQNAAHQKAAAERPQTQPVEQSRGALKDGWFPFLASLEGPDIPLWHQIATDFDDLYGDRLNAAYWILEQPECDRATAWEFVVEAILNEVLLAELKEDTKNANLPVSRRSLFEAVLRRWSEGFYRYHSIRIGEVPARYLDGLQSDVDGQTAAAGQPPIILPEGFTTHPGPPQHDYARSHSHGYAFSSQDGLVMMSDV